MSKDKELEIHLKASGGKAAAKEVERVEEALSDVAEATEAVGKSTVEDLAPAWEAATEAAGDMAEAVEEVAESSDTLDDVQRDVSESADRMRRQIEEATAAVEDLAEASDGQGGAAPALEGLSKKKIAATLQSRTLSAATGGLSAKLSRMLTPVGLATAAVGFLVQRYMQWKRALDEIVAAAAERLPLVDRGHREVAEAAKEHAAQVEGARTAVGDYVAASEDYLQTLRQQAEDTQTLAEIEHRRTMEIIKQRELLGEITGDEARAEREEAEDARRAEQHAARIAQLEEEIRILRERAEILAPEAAAARGDADAARDRADAGSTGAVALDASVLAPELNDAVTAAAEEARRVKAELEAMREEFAEARKRDDLERGVELRPLLAGLEQQAEQAEADLAEARERREMQIKHEREIAQSLADAREREAEAAERAAALAEESVTEAEAAAERARTVEQQQIDAAQEVVEIQRENAQIQREKAEAERRQAEAERAANASAAQVASGIEATVAAAPNADAAPELIATLSRIAEALADGTDSAELAQVDSELAGALAGLASSQAAARAVVEQVRRELAQIREQFNNSL